MKKYITSTICLIMLAIAAFATAASIVNSKHDIRHIIGTHDSWGFNTGPRLMINQYGEVCVYCHTPHSGSVQAPLWNRSTPIGAYTPYNSATINTSIPGMPNPMSLICLSCHDGTIAVDSIINAPGSGMNPAGPWYGEAASLSHPAMAGTTGVFPSVEFPDAVFGDECGDCHKPGGGPFGVAHDAERAYFSTNNSNDHPISMSYPLPAQDPFFQNIASIPGSDLKLFSGKVECPSCHDVHDPGISPFLRMSDSGSDLCKTCHKK